MPAPSVPVQHRGGEAPPPGPLAPFDRSAGTVTLGVAGLGCVTVDDAGITAIGPDQGSRAAVLARLGTWAEAQWYARSGFTVVRGTVVGREGCGVLLAARSQQGASITAALMTRLGWGLVSDGLAVIDEDGIVLARRPEVHLDTIAADRLFPQAPRQVLPTGRARTCVDVVGHGDATLSDVIVMRVTNAISEIDVIGPTVDDRVTTWVQPVRPLLPAPGPPADLPMVRSWVMARPIPTSLAMADRVLPPKVAAALDTALRPHLAGVEDTR